MELLGISSGSKMFQPRNFAKAKSNIIEFSFLHSTEFDMFFQDIFIRHIVGTCITSTCWGFQLRTSLLYSLIKFWEETPKDKWGVGGYLSLGTIILSV